MLNEGSFKYTTAMFVSSEDPVVVDDTAFVMFHQQQLSALTINTPVLRVLMGILCFPWLTVDPTGIIIIKKPQEL